MGKQNSGFLKVLPPFHRSLLPPKPILLFFFSLLIFLSACQSGDDQTEIEHPIYRFVLRSLLDEDHILTVDEVGKNAKLRLLDTRTEEEYQVSRLPGAQWLGFQPINEELLRQFQTEDTLLVYCSIGYRSEQVADELRAKGFNNVFNLYGGIFEWVNQGKTLENETGEPTRQVHPYNFWWGLFLTEGEKTKTPL